MISLSPTNIGSVCDGQQGICLPRGQDLPPPTHVMPSLRGGSFVLWAYDGTPDARPWLEWTTSLAQESAPSRDLLQLLAFKAEPLGAPLGAYCETSTRVARVTGLLMDASTSEPTPKGLAMAHGRVSAYWEASCEGLFLSIAFQEPTCAGSGAAKDVLSQEQLKVRCMRQYELQARSLISNIDEIGQSHGVQVQFIGNWDDSTTLIRKKLAKTCVMEWAQARCFTLCAA